MPDDTAIFLGRNKREPVSPERTVSELQTCLHSLFQYAGVSLVLLDGDGVICLWNPASEKLFGYRGEEMLGRADTFLIPADRLEEVRQQRDRVFAGETLKDVSTERMRRDGTRVPVLLTLCPVRDAAEQTVAVVEIAQFSNGRSVRSQADETAWNEADRELESLLASLPLESVEGMALVGRSPPFLEVQRQISRLGPTGATVLILGESGTGKELVARAIHQASTRRDRPFVAVNCAAIPRELLESDLFGHERGAFTGAFRRKIGRLEAARGGTVFLDEVCELPLELQPKLLRVLEERNFTRLGGLQEIEQDVRFLAATNRPILEQVRNGAFREDLYYRLSVARIVLPPLRERREDLPLLADVLLGRISARHREKRKHLEPEAERLLAQHSWPGNVRELANVLEQAFLLCEKESIGPEEVVPLLEGMTAERLAPASGFPADASLEQVEAEHIRRVLEAVRWNKTEAAQILGIGRDTLYRKMRKYGLDLTHR